MNIDQVKQEIVAFLRPLAPEKVILFGSYACGVPTEDSDIDLYIVSREEGMLATYEENLRHYRKYARVLRPIKERYPVDIIVHTLGMNRVFEKNASSFSREIVERGIRLI